MAVTAQLIRPKDLKILKVVRIDKGSNSDSLKELDKLIQQTKEKNFKDDRYWGSVTISR